MQQYPYSVLLSILLLPIFLLSFSACESEPASGTQKTLVTDVDTLDQQMGVRGIPASESQRPPQQSRVLTGPEVLISTQLETLRGLKIAVVANHTSLVFGKTHLVDTLLAAGISVTKVFAPEHGFRGTADAGEKVKDGVDTKTGLPILSLYGKNRKPTASQLAGLDLVIFDIQDIGSRHYTYIGTMTYVMEACGELGIPVMVLDRPNPNGWYVEGPVLEKKHSSFIGMHEIPIAHGMTIAEYAQMVNGEGWMEKGVQVELKTVLAEGYRHRMTWEDTGLDWVSPSPNIATEYASYLYPAICWFEATNVSLGRGTHDAFTIMGAPWYPGSQPTAREEAFADPYGLTTIPYAFTPVSLPGKSKFPKFQDTECQGFRFEGRVGGKDLFLAGLALLLEFEQSSKAVAYSEGMWKYKLERWAGNTELQQQIESGLSPEEIYNSWQEKTDAFRQTRKKYLLYPDFE